jgi:hypothetical protein
MGWLFHGCPATRMAEVETPGMGLLRPVNKLPHTHLQFCFLHIENFANSTGLMH